MFHLYLTIILHVNILFTTSTLTFPPFQLFFWCLSLNPVFFSWYCPCYVCVLCVKDRCSIVGIIWFHQKFGIVNLSEVSLFCYRVFFKQLESLINSAGLEEDRVQVKLFRVCLNHYFFFFALFFCFRNYFYLLLIFNFCLIISREANVRNHFLVTSSLNSISMRIIR